MVVSSGISVASALKSRSSHRLPKYFGLSVVGQQRNSSKSRNFFNFIFQAFHLGNIFYSKLKSLASHFREAGHHSAKAISELLGSVPSRILMETESFLKSFRQKCSRPTKHRSLNRSWDPQSLALVP